MILPAPLAVLLFFLIPVLLYVLSYVIIKFSDKESDSRIRRWLSWAKRPVTFCPLSEETVQSIPNEERKQYIKKEIAVRIFVVYLIVGMFLLSNIVGTFYHILADVLQEVGQGSTGEIRTWSTIVYTTPFSGGWLGSFPWYGYNFWPPANSDIYHEPWNWVYHTSALVTGNPNFFGGMAADMIIVSVIVGTIILLPLAKKSVRTSFLPSVIHLHLAMLTIMSGIFNCYAEAFGLSILSNTIIYGSYYVDATDLNGLPSFIITTFTPILVVVSFIFLAMSYRLSGSLYPASKRARWIFALNTGLQYWLSLVLIILV